MQRPGATRPPPPMVAVVGRKKSGKTTTVLALVAELRRRGLRVMTIKHGHQFDLDRPGTDSHRHREEAGAERVVLAGPSQFAVVGSWPDAMELGARDLASQYLPDADIVVVEGFKHEGLPMIEVFRTAAGHAPLWRAGQPASGYLAAVTDNDGYAAAAPFPTVHPADPGLGSRLADLVEREVIGTAERGEPDEAGGDRG